jgi:hypothetical protein
MLFDRVLRRTEDVVKMVVVGRWMGIDGYGSQASHRIMKRSLKIVD